MIDLQDDNVEYLSKQISGENFSGQKITSKEFEDCTFTECDFSDVTLDKCDFIDCHFIKCNLSVVKLGYSKFSDVVFEECKVIGVDWTKATWPNLTNYSQIKFHQCILNDSSFYGLGLEELVMEGCKAHDVDFREANVKEANFSGTDFLHSLFGKTNLSLANFSESINYSIDVYNNFIKGAKFCRYEAVSLLESLEIELVD